MQHALVANFDFFFPEMCEYGSNLCHFFNMGLGSDVTKIVNDA
jgi:hypothetical protein